MHKHGGDKLPRVETSVEGEVEGEELSKDAFGRREVGGESEY